MGRRCLDPPSAPLSKQEAVLIAMKFIELCQAMAALADN